MPYALCSRRSHVCYIILGVMLFVIIGWIAMVARPSVIVLQKLATQLVMPVGLIWMVLVVLCVEAFRRGQRAFAALATLVLFVYTLTTNGLVAHGLVRSLENPYLAIHPLKQGEFDAVIVMGGGASEGPNGRARGNGSGDRLILAAQMYHQGLAETLICTGERIPELDVSGVDAGRTSASILENLNIPETAIEFTRGRNTAEEMVALGKRYGDSGKRVGLITSAWHLPRAIRLARKCGFEPEPLPADFLTGPETDQPPTILAFAPSAEALNGTGIVMKEYLARMVGR